MGVQLSLHEFTIHILICRFAKFIYDFTFLYECVFIHCINCSKKASAYVRMGAYVTVIQRIGFVHLQCRI